MALGVLFDPSLGKVPRSVTKHLREVLLDVSAVLESIPRDSAVLDLMEAAPLQADIDGWLFRYKLDRQRGGLVVVEAMPPSKARP